MKTRLVLQLAEGHNRQIRRFQPEVRGAKSLQLAIQAPLYTDFNDLSPQPEPPPFGLIYANQGNQLP